MQQVRQGADNPSIAGALDAKIAELRKTVGHNRYVAKFNVAADISTTSAGRNHRHPRSAAAHPPTRSSTWKKARRPAGVGPRQKAQFAAAAIHNQFVAVLQEATVLFKAKKLAEAASLVERQLAVLTDPEDVKLAHAFIDECRKPTLRPAG